MDYLGIFKWNFEGTCQPSCLKTCGGPHPDPGIANQSCFFPTSQNLFKENAAECPPHKPFPSASSAILSSSCWKPQLQVLCNTKVLPMFLCRMLGNMHQTSMLSVLLSLVLVWGGGKGEWLRGRKELLVLKPQGIIANEPGQQLCFECQIMLARQVVRCKIYICINSC